MIFGAVLGFGGYAFIVRFELDWFKSNIDNTWVRGEQVILRISDSFWHAVKVNQIIIICILNW